MNGKSCFFIGHRETPDNVLPLLQETVNRHIECYGVTEFIVGHYGNFDYLAAKAVIAAKQLHPEIILSLLILITFIFMVDLTPDRIIEIVQNRRANNKQRRAELAEAALIEAAEAEIEAKKHKNRLAQGFLMVEPNVPVF